jgi:hypothetical protein
VTSPISSAVHLPPLPYVGRGVPGGRLAMPRPALYDRRVPTEGQPNPYLDPSRLLEAILAAPSGTEGPSTGSRLIDRDVGFSKVRLARY